MNYGFVIDNRKCIGCHACTVACKSEHDVAIGVNRTWVKYIEKGEFPNSRRYFSVMRCNHCEKAPCVDICPVSALHFRDDGIVDFDNRRCIGCKSCMQACPYDALYIDPNTHTAAKCNYCAHRVDMGLNPACVNICPEQAIIAGDLDDSQSAISQLIAREQVTARKVEKGTVPNLYYIDADISSITPSAAPPQTTYTQAQQTAGVGHFAHYAEKRLSAADKHKMAEELAKSTSYSQQESPEDYGVTVPISNNGGNGKVMEKAWAVVQETVQRVYDAPSKGAVWGWEVSAYVWTKAIAAGAFLLPFLYELFKPGQLPEEMLWAGSVLSLVFLTLTGMLLIKDLDKPTRFLYVLLRPQKKSWLVRGGYAITVYGGLVTLWMVWRFLGLREFEPVIITAALVFSVIVAVYTAFLFGQAKGRDFWQSPALAPHMLIHAFMAGSAVFSLLISWVWPQSVLGGFFASALLYSLLINIAILAVELLAAHPTTDAKLTVQMIVSGRFRILFWAGTVVVGNLLPLLMLGTQEAALFAPAAVLVLIGMYVTEHIWVRAPQLVPLS